MKQIDLSAVDLNLLVALDALLDEGSVTRAARRCGVGQSAMSHSLRRLRALFADPLLVRDGRQMVATPRAETLRAPLRRTLDAVRAVLTHEVVFDPARSRRRFRMVCTDLAAGVLPELMQTLNAEAPGITVELRTPGASVADALRAGGDDLGIGPPPANGAGLMQRVVGTLEWAVMMRAGHPAATGPWDPARWLEWPHIVVRTGSLSRSMVADALEARGLTRTVGLVVPGFLLGPPVVARTDLFFAAPVPFIGPFAEHAVVITRPPPVPLPSVPVVVMWPERVHGDPGHRWFRQRVARALSRRLLPEAGR